MLATKPKARKWGESFNNLFCQNIWTFENSAYLCCIKRKDMGSGIKTFAELEKQVLAEGYKVAILNRFISRFDSENGYAIIYYLGAGKGFELQKYSKEIL